MARRGAGTAILTLLLTPALGLSQDFQVNTYTTGNAANAAVAGGAIGPFVVLWNNSSDVYLRRFAADGVPLDNGSRLNTYTTGNQSSPAVAAFGTGFLVVWQSFDLGGQYLIQTRALSSSGSPIADEAQLPTGNSGFPAHPALAVAPGGAFLVVWQAEPSMPDASVLSIRAQRFASSGVPLGASFQVNTFTTGYQRYPDVAADAAGNFLVVWQSGVDDSAETVELQRVSPSGALLGGETQLNTYTSGGPQRPKLARGRQGDFAVVWDSNASPGGDTSDRSIQMRRLAAGGSPLSVQMEINVYTSGAQGRPVVAEEPRGGFVVSWESSESPEDDDSSFSVLVRELDNDGGTLAIDRQVNEYTTSTQSRADIATTTNGDVIVVWHSLGSSGDDDDSGSIQMRFFDLGIFADGFELGDTTAWSLTAPP